MSLTRYLHGMDYERGLRSHSAQGLANVPSSPCMKIPLPPRLWITDISDNSSEDSDGMVRDDNVMVDRPRVRSRYRHHKHRAVNSIPIGIFWDIENCQVPRGCSAIDVVAAIRAKFLNGRREADFVVVCDVRKESAQRLQELNDAQVSLIHVCGTQKNAADEKLRQCMRRFGELHSAPAALLLISGDINFAADLSDFRHRKNMEVILVHKQNTSSALITCASSNYCYSALTADLPRNPKVSQCEEEDPTCEIEIVNLPMDQPPDRVSRRLRRLADNCGGKVLRVTASTAMLKFPTPDHASRALKRMDGEDVFGYKIGTRYVRAPAHTYSSDEGYGTATQPANTPRTQPTKQLSTPVAAAKTSSGDWAQALQQLPPPPRFNQPPKPRKIRGTHGSSAADVSGGSSVHSGDEFRRDSSGNRAISPWNSSFSELSSDDPETNAELTITNLPPYEPKMLQEMLTQLFTQYVPVVRVSVWVAAEGPIATVVFKSEWDARLAIARVHKRRLDNQWVGRRLELSLGRPSPAPNLDVLRARLRAILLDQKNCTLPLLRLRDAYASRHCCALTTSDIAKVHDTVVIHEGFGRMVQLVDLTPRTLELEEAPWKCHIHAAFNTGQEDGSKILTPVVMEIAVLARHTKLLLDNHGGILPLLSFVECYESSFPPLVVDGARGVALELLLRSVPGICVRDTPSRHIALNDDRGDTPSPLSSYSEGERSSKEREKPRTAPALEPMLTLFERELVDLLRTTARCSIPFSKLIPAFHHHFGRQCRVADYGFTKLPDLLAALSNTIVVLGSGSSRIITISAAAQARRWTADLGKLLRSQPGRTILQHEIPQYYQMFFGKPFTPVDYGVCTLHELMQRVSPQSIVLGQDGSVSLPRRTPTPEEKTRTLQFALQAVELLCYTPNLRMEFSRFVPAFHAHFGRQLRVAQYGCVKLVDLFEVIPEAVRVGPSGVGEREVRLALKPSKAILCQRMKTLNEVPIENFATVYANSFGGLPLPDMMDVFTYEELVIAAGGAIENGVIKGPGFAPWSISMCLTAAAALSSDRSVGGSTDEYFVLRFREMFGKEPDFRHLLAAGVVSRAHRRVQLNPSWRTIWRLAQILSVSQPMAAQHIHNQYINKFEPTFPSAELGFENVADFMRHYREVFIEEVGSYFAICSGVIVPRVKIMPITDELSIQDTPPGQKGSRVFESPKISLWCSPPASSLPAPSALLSIDKRRTRLAAQFNAA